MPQIHYFCLSLEGTFPSWQPGKSLLTFAVQTSKRVDSSPDQCGPGLYQLHSQNLASWFSFFLSFFSLQGRKMPENVFPTPIPPLPYWFRFLIAVPGPSRACPVTLQGLARPPRLLAGPDLAGVSRTKSPTLFPSEAGGGVPQFSCLLRVRGRGSPSWQVSLWSMLGVFLSQTQDAAGWEILETGHSFA